jgi:hypothetical protein
MNGIGRGIKLRNAYKILMGKPEGKRTVESPRQRGRIKWILDG